MVVKGTWAASKMPRNIEMDKPFSDGGKEKAVGEEEAEEEAAEEAAAGAGGGADDEEGAAAGAGGGAGDEEEAAAGAGGGAGDDDDDARVNQAVMARFGLTGGSCAAVLRPSFRFAALVWSAASWPSALATPGRKWAALT